MNARDTVCNHNVWAGFRGGTLVSMDFRLSHLVLSTSGSTSFIRAGRCKGAFLYYVLQSLCL